MEYLVDAHWLHSETGSEDLMILDCTVLFCRIEGTLNIASGLAGWQSAHIPTSRHVDLLVDLSDPTSEFRFTLPPASRVASALGTLGVGEETRVVLYDADKNMWAARMWWMLKSLGFTNAAVLDGGLKTWISEGLPVTTESAPTLSPLNFYPTDDNCIFVDKEVVLAAISDNDTCIVNALSASQHNGYSADYGRLGHIPGAINIPASSLIAEDTHSYLHLDSLRRLLGPVRDSAPTTIITYCGGGISAASVAFVLFLLGEKSIRIYDGSMEEWGSNPSLPLTS